jgi:hypothetical protein
MITFGCQLNFPNSCPQKSTTENDFVKLELMIELTQSPGLKNECIL